MIGTAFGGNGTTTFGLPDMDGRVPMHPGQSSSGGSQHKLGEKDGEPVVTLSNAQMPTHNHPYVMSRSPATTADPYTQLFAQTGGVGVYNDNAQPTTTLHPGAVMPAGGGKAHNNMMPSLAMTFCIATAGVFPT